MNQDPAKPASAMPCARAQAAPRRALDSRALFAGGHELLIEHNGYVYTLRLTRNGKLILTK